MKTLIEVYDVWYTAPNGGQYLFVSAGPCDLPGTATHHSWPMVYDNFATGSSDYDMASDEVYCPCGETLSCWDGTAGQLIRMIDQHCRTSGHPMPKLEM